MAKQTSKDNTSVLFHRYVWLVDAIYRTGRITFEALNERWMRSELNQTGDELPVRTFHNHRYAIEQMFDVNIECDRRVNEYYIADAADVSRDGVRTWLLNTFAVDNLINESHRLRHRILFEQIPSGQRFLTPLIEAMRDAMAVETTYQSFTHEQPSTFVVEPYALKLFRQRWYLVAYNDYYQDIRIYALDRMQDVKVTDQHFDMCNNFDASEYFCHAFGIDTYAKPLEVRIKVYNTSNKVKYFRSLPLHHSQQEVEEGNGYSIFRYYIRPTYDFRKELLSHGDEVEVLSPVEFRNEVAQVIGNQLNYYQ